MVPIYSQLQLNFEAQNLIHFDFDFQELHNHFGITMAVW